MHNFLSVNKIAICVYLTLFLASHANAEIDKGITALQGADYKKAAAEFRKSSTPEQMRKAAPLYRKAMMKLVEVEAFRKTVLRSEDDTLKQDFTWFSKAADQGLIDAQFVLGHMYSLGVGEKKNENLSKTWIEKAANAGDAIAQQHIAKMLMIKKKYKESLLWLQKSADQDYPEAIANMAWVYQYADNMEKNFKKAINLTERAAKLGHASSQMALCMAYQGYPEGFVKKDKTKAAPWCALAGERGDRMAARDYSKLLASLNAEQKSQVEKLVKEYTQKYLAPYRTNDTFVETEKKKILIQFQNRQR